MCFQPIPVSSVAELLCVRHVDGVVHVDVRPCPHCSKLRETAGGEGKGKIVGAHVKESGVVAV